MELMTTLVIAGVLTTIAVPSFRTVVKNNRMATQANTFVTAMTLARSEAIKRGVTIDVVATNTSNTANEWGGGWLVKVDGGATIRNFSALESSSTMNSDGNTYTYQYLSSGRISPTDTLYLCDDRTGETGRKITISVTGHLSIADYTCA